MRRGKRLILGTRTSPLALAQARKVVELFAIVRPDLPMEIAEILTGGDQNRSQPLTSLRGKGLFVKELERALLAGKIDLAVHSLKDLPVRIPKGLVLGAVVGREDVHDALYTADGTRLKDLVQGSHLGSGSPRRRGQILWKFPNLRFQEIRGNVESRMEKVDRGECRGTVLAVAGLKRLGFWERLGRRLETLPFSLVLPAPGQGALGLECRASDRWVRGLLEGINQKEVMVCTQAERACLEGLGGGCHLPLGALAELSPNGKTILLKTALTLPDGSGRIRVSMMGDPEAPKTLGQEAARKILGKKNYQATRKVLVALGMLEK